MKKIVIAGGGVSGLAARYFLSKKYPQAEITLFEKRERLGGCIRSETTPFFFERGPRTFKVSRSKELLDLIDELGLSSEVIHSSKEAQKRFLWKNQKLHSLMPMVVKMLPGLFKERWQPSSGEADESIEAFARRRFGSGIAKTFVDPITLGIYAGDTRKLSVRSCFPTLKEFETEYGSVTKGMLKKKKSKHSKALFTLKGGLNLLVERLVEKGRGPIHLNTPLEKVPDGVDLCVVAVPPAQAQLLLASYAESENLFGSLESVSLSVVNVAFDTSVLKQKGFGYLIPSDQGEEILGVVFDSAIFPEQNGGEERTRLTVMMGGAFHPDIDKRTCEEKALNALKNHLGITCSPIYTHVEHYSQAIPQFLVGHQERVEKFEAALKCGRPKVACIGNYLHGVSVNDCIRLAEAAANLAKSDFFDSPLN